MGNVLFADGEWSNGKIVIDIENESSYDKIAFDGTLSKTGENISMEFIFDANSMSELIQSSETGSFNIGDAITYAEGSSIEGTVLNGIYDGIKWEAMFGDTSMNVSFTNIPRTVVNIGNIRFGGNSAALCKAKKAVLIFFENSGLLQPEFFYCPSMPVGCAQNKNMHY